MTNSQKFDTFRQIHKCSAISFLTKTAGSAWGRGVGVSWAGLFGPCSVITEERKGEGEGKEEGE